jgi:hypothetical protein
MKTFNLLEGNRSEWEGRGGEPRELGLKRFIVCWDDRIYFYI